jgi:VWFA-related protein
MRTQPLPAVSVLVLLGVTVAATAPGANAAASSQQRPRFEASVNRVRVNVIVTDGEGRFVDDLNAEDFRVYEDGELREGIEVQLVDLSAGMVTPLRTTLSTEEPATSPRPVATPDAADNDVVVERFGAVVFFIDLTGIDHVTKLHFNDRWEQYLESKSAITVPTAVYLVDQAGILTEIAPLTTNIDELRAAQQSVDAQPLTRSYFGSALPSIATPPGGGAPAGGDATARFDAFTEYDRSFYTFSLLAQFCDALATRAGRTAVVWVSRGVTLRGTFQDRGYEPNSTLLRLQRELHEAANSANVSIYGVDPRRYIDLLGGDASATRAGSRGDEIGNTLRAAAAETGGRHFIAWADFGEVVDEIETDSSRYYLLTYPVPDNRGDGSYHEIRVEVARPDVSVRANEGYTDHSEEERRSRFVSAALTLPGTVNDIPVSAEVFRGAADGDRTEVIVAVAIDGEPLGIQNDDDGEPMQRVEVHGVLLDTDDDMAVVEEMSRQVTEGIEDEMGATNDWLLSKQEWELRPGSYDLRVMAIDDATGAVGTAQLDVEIPDIEEDAWHVGDVMLIETRDDETSLPVVQGRVRADSTVVAAIEVRGGRQPVADGWVRGVDQPAGEGASLIPLPLRRERGGHRGTILLPPLTPGEYVLELRVADAAPEREHLVETALHVIDTGRR